MTTTTIVLIIIAVLLAAIAVALYSILHVLRAINRHLTATLYSAGAL